MPALTTGASATAALNRKTVPLYSDLLLHDIGTAVDYDDHHKHSRYLILNAGLPGYSPRETAIIGQAARYHRKGQPGMREFSPLAHKGDEELLARFGVFDTERSTRRTLEHERDPGRRFALAAMSPEFAVT